MTSYSSQTATLVLEHNYPKGNHLKAFVDVEHLLGTLKSSETQVGEWVNVMGYITPEPRDEHTMETQNTWKSAFIQAIVLWSAGPIRLDKYESSLDQQKIGCLT